MKSASLAVVLFVLLSPPTACVGQSSSLFGAPGERRPMTLDRYSWTVLPPPEPKKIGLRDTLTVIVEKASVVTSEGEVDRRKKASFDTVLKDWILLDGLALVPDPQSKGDPKISGEWNNKYRAEGGLETRDSMQFTIAVEVVDIRPNGLLVIEGHQRIQNNDEVWEQSISGIVRPEDVSPANTVLSEKIAELNIYKREAGHVRDGYRRGWLLKTLDKYQPF